MSDQPSEAAARQAVAAAKAELDQAAAEARTRFEKQAAELRPRIKYAEGRIAHWEGLAGQLAPHAAHPEGGFLLRGAQLMTEMHAALKKMLAIELAVHEGNIQLLPTDLPNGPIPFRKAQDDLNFHEQRLRADAALVQILWRASRDGIDLVFRAANAVPERDGSDAADEAARNARADAVRQAATEDLSLERLVEALGEELAEVRDLLGWVTGAFAGFDKLPAEGRRQLLQDGRWGEVGAVIEKLKRLHARVGGYPALSKWFPRPQDVDLPYAPPSEEAPKFGAATAAPTAKLHDQVQLNSGPTSRFKLGQPPPRPPR